MRALSRFVGVAMGLALVVLGFNAAIADGMLPAGTAFSLPFPAAGGTVQYNVSQALLNVQNLGSGNGASISANGGTGIGLVVTGNASNPPLQLVGQADPSNALAGYLSFNSTIKALKEGDGTNWYPVAKMTTASLSVGAGTAVVTSGATFCQAGVVASVFACDCSVSGSTASVSCTGAGTATAVVSFF